MAEEYKRGQFGKAGLPLAKNYIHPRSRAKSLWWGLAGTVFFGLLIGGLVLWMDRGGLANGPVASAHAAFEDDCSSCHQAFSTVPNQKCSSCHEKFGDELGVFTMTAHAVYRSEDFSRMDATQPASQCRDCHQDHMGRHASLTDVAVLNCTNCHESHQFNQQHPAFEPAPEPGNLNFAHAAHVQQIIERTGQADMEKACLYCHNPKPDGKTFEPLSFDRHCDSCHLSLTTATPALPVVNANRSELGVWLPATFLDTRQPNSLWAQQETPTAYRTRDGKVSKRGITHADPWIMANLRRLRKELYAEEGLTELLDASPDIEPRAVHRLYEEALANLSAQASELSARPERTVQTELAEIEREIATIRRQLEDPYTPLDQTKFLSAVTRADANVSETRVEEVRGLMADLAQPCTPCHAIYDGLVGRVQKDQRAFIRAEFNHRAHIIQRRCLDCHNAIPMDAASAKAMGHHSPQDASHIQNLPGIDTCRQCHSDAGSDNRCITCHEFHPNKERRSDLLLYLD